MKRVLGCFEKELEGTTSFLDKFKAFIRRGNVVDLAVGVIIGGAFGKIVTSLVNDVVMPPLGLLLSRFDFKNLKWTLKSAQGAEPAVTINYGVFLSTCVDFLLVALVIFVVVELVHRLHQSPEPPKADTRECPYCASSISVKAKRCPQCISNLQSDSERAPSPRGHDGL